MSTEAQNGSVNIFFTRQAFRAAHQLLEAFPLGLSLGEISDATGISRQALQPALRILTDHTWVEKITASTRNDRPVYRIPNRERLKAKMDTEADKFRRIAPDSGVNPYIPDEILRHYGTSNPI